MKKQKSADRRNHSPGSPKKSQGKARKHTPKVTIGTTGQQLTSQAGLIPVVKFLEKIGFERMLENTLLHNRQGSNAVYTMKDVILLSIVGIIGGATSLTGILVIWADGVLARLAGWVRIPDDSTLGRILKTVRERHISEMETLVHKARTEVWKRALRSGTSNIRGKKCVTVDADSTVKTVYGEQEGAQKGYNPHKRGAKSVHPLIAFCSQTKEILQGCYRCGSAYTSNGIIEFVRQLLAHLPDNIKIMLRADSGFFNGMLLDFLEKYSHAYLIKVKLRNLTKLLAGQIWTAIKRQPGWEECVFWYKCNGWKEERRFIAVRVKVGETESGEPIYNYFCYVTSEELTPWQAHKSYGQRATCETWIDEAKNQMSLAHIKTGDFLANAMLFQCAILAYNIIRWMALCSHNRQLLKWEVGTIRTFLIRVVGKLISGGRQMTLKISDSLIFMKEWESWVEVGLV